MSDDELLKWFNEWKRRAGKPKALTSLISLGVSPRTAEYMTNEFDDYKRTPRRKLRNALRAIFKKNKAS